MAKPKKLDLSIADGYSLTEADLLVEALKKDGLYKQNLLYRGFDGEQLDTILEHGTDTTDNIGIFCANEDELLEGGAEGLNPFDYAIECKVPAIAVYDGNKFYDGDSVVEREFIDPENKLDALVAVYLLSWR